MPKRGLFRRDRAYQQVDPETAERAFACLYALHGALAKRELRARKGRPLRKRR